MRNFTYNGIFGEGLNQGFIGGSNLDIYNSTFENMQFSNGEGNYKSFLGAIPLGSARILDFSAWNLSSNIFRNMNLTDMSVIELYDDTVSSNNNYKLSNIIFESINCSITTNSDSGLDVLPSINGIGSALNTPHWQLSDITVINAINPLFARMESVVGKIDNLFYTTSQHFTTDAETINHDATSILYVDSLANVEINNLEISYEVMENVFDFIAFDISVVFNASEEQDTRAPCSQVDISSVNGVDYIEPINFHFLPRILSNEGVATLNNIRASSDWNKTEVVGSLYDTIMNEYGCEPKDLQNAIESAQEYCPQHVSSINYTVTLFCKYFTENIDDKNEFIVDMPISFKYSIENMFEQGLFYNHAAGDMIINNLYVGLGTTSTVFSNDGYLVMKHVSTYLYKLIDENTGTNVSLIYDTFDLYPNIIGHNTGNVFIESSHLSGFQCVGLLTTGGTANMNHSIISYTNMPVISGEGTKV